ncbi:NTP transferase domain-containing protein [Pelosinus sp. sgz500959]|uniref:nucleotidyltransferase family protein n=1 Tax=Pelosinus sp. sgz500959 TaxID=3242472 RepID=UPI00366EB190
MVTGVILAAGQAGRMGQPKQLLSLGGKPMVWHVASTVCQANFHEVIVITGAYGDEVTQVLNGLPLRIIYNKQWADGQSTSVKKAIQSVNPKSQAVVFLLADQPLVDTVLINEVIATYQATKSRIVMPRAQNRPGNPVLFDLKVWRSALLQLSGDEGARQIIRKNQGDIQYIERLNEEMFLDVDTPAEFEIMKKKWQILKDS